LLQKSGQKWQKEQRPTKGVEITRKCIECVPLNPGKAFGIFSNVVAYKSANSKGLLNGAIKPILITLRDKLRKKELVNQPAAVLANPSRIESIVGILA
jgi:hypothetical protein